MGGGGVGRWRESDQLCPYGCLLIKYSNNQTMWTLESKNIWHRSKYADSTFKQYFLKGGRGGNPSTPFPFSDVSAPEYMCISQHSYLNGGWKSADSKFERGLGEGRGAGYPHTSLALTVPPAPVYFSQKSCLNEKNWWWGLDHDLCRKHQKNMDSLWNWVTGIDEICEKFRHENGWRAKSFQVHLPYVRDMCSFLSQRMN